MSWIGKVSCTPGHLVFAELRNLSVPGIFVKEGVTWDLFSLARYGIYKYPDYIMRSDVLLEICYGINIQRETLVGAEQFRITDDSDIRRLLQKLSTLGGLQHRLLLATEQQLAQLELNKSASEPAFNKLTGHHNLKKDVRVAFTASLTSTKQGLSVGSTIVFDSVSINLGNSYSSTAGIFTCPNSGNYFFMTSLMSGPSNKINTEIVVDGVAKAAVFGQSNANTLNIQSSNSAVAHCTTGQRVFVRVKDGTSVYGDNSSRLTQFTGYLIWED